MSVFKTCAELGWKVGDKFRVLADDCISAGKGDIVTLKEDDGSCCPYYKTEYGNTICIFTGRVERIDTLQVPPVGGIDAVLEERGNRYGSFVGHALITQKLKRTMHNSGNWHELSPEMKESLEMVAHKIGRILNGDPLYKDSWTDIIGYVKLIEDTLED